MGSATTAAAMGRSSGVVVGIDESRSAANALRWAHRYAEQNRLPLTALLAWDYIGQHHRTAEEPFDPGYSEDKARSVLEALVGRILGSDGDIVCDVVLDLPGPALVEAGSCAQLVVVGARGMGGFRGLLLGSVSRYVLRHASTTVCVVRDQRIGGNGGIVVGVDGSASSGRVLEWASAFKASDDRPLIAVTLQPARTVARRSDRMVADNRRSRSSGSTLTHALQHVAPDMSVDRRVTGGRTAAELLAIAQAEDASVLVVGGDHPRGLTRLMSASVSTEAVQHAACPVVVVR